MATSHEVQQLRERLGVARGTLVDGWLATAFDYFRDVVRADPLDPLHLQYVRGIDFHRLVTVDQLRSGQPLVRFPEIIGGLMQPERQKPYRFFALPGGTPLHLGWNPDEVGFQLYQLRQSVRALVSSASAIRFRDARSRLGGDRQVVIPWTTNVVFSASVTSTDRKSPIYFDSGICRWDFLRRVPLRAAAQSVAALGTDCWASRDSRRRETPRRRPCE
jgi:hypothetical protein